MEWTGERDTFDSCPSQIVAKKAVSRNFSISFLDISSTKILLGKSMCISEGHGGAGLACGPASAHCILSKS